ncbi:MAG: rod shape-determining protein MreD [Proteobacteria bacterium]|nr:rod shape-determining protein MreD [Pseudomonadota bacterium]MBU1234984.1 rod shape-determining protein MreD [Pseudomonadota bacterium]MBU1417605.1 rod shape-determining protein MreD [Pseudomonadota bacterium]MBU1454756.1 rod shape-determining protein MreD [Pseudomonadota bacterium]
MVTASFILLGVFLIIAETTFLQFFPHWLGRPDLVFILLVFVAYKFNWFRGLLLAFLLGWLMDVASGVFLGTYLLLSLLLFAIVKFLSQNSPVKDTACQIPLVGVSYFVVQCLFYLFFSMAQPGALPPWSWSRVLQETIILFVASLPCFVFLNWLYEKISHRHLAVRSMKRRTGNRFR